MAFNTAFGVIQWLAADTVGTTYTVNLPAGFDLKAIRFYTVGIGSAVDATSGALAARMGFGVATGTAARRACGSIDFDNNTSNVCGAAIRDDCVIVHANSDGTITALLDITTFSSEQFILTVDDAGTDVTVGWRAWGGSDITVAAVGDFAEPAATGVQSYAVTGFTAAGTDQVVMLAGCNVTAALNTAHDIGSGIYCGYFTGSASANNIVVVGNSQDTAATSITDGYCQTGECLAMIPAAGGHPDARAIGNFATDAFELDWLERTTTGRKSIYLALKGGQWAAGAYTIDGTTLSATATVSGLAFELQGIDTLGRMTAQDTLDTSTVHKRFGFGSADSTTARQSMGMLAVDASAVSNINVAIDYDSALCFPSSGGALLAAYDINAINTDGFGVIVDVAGGVASEWQGYLAFGVAPTTVYLRNTTDNGIGATYYDLSETAGASLDSAVVDTTASGTEIQFTKTAGGAIAQWISGRAPAGGFTLTKVGATLFGLESSDLVNAKLRLRVFKRTAAGVETELGGGPFDAAAELATTVLPAHTFDADVTDTAFAEDDRVLLKVYVTNVGTMAVGTATLRFNTGTGDSFFRILPYVAFKAEDSGVSGTLAVTTANDTLAAAGTTTIVGTLAKTTADDTLAASGTTTVTGTLAVTTANDTLAASGSVGDAVTGTLAETNANDTLAGSGQVTISGVVAVTAENDTLAASGVAGTVTGTLDVTAGGDSLSAAGTGPASATVDGGGKWTPTRAYHLGETLPKRKRRAEPKPISEPIPEPIQAAEPSPLAAIAGRIAELARAAMAQNAALTETDAQIAAFFAYQQEEMAAIERAQRQAELQAERQEDEDILILMLAA